MAKKTKNLNLPIISSEDYPTTKVVDMIDDIEGDKEGSAFNIIDDAVGIINTNISTLQTGLATKQSKLEVNPDLPATLKLGKIKIDGVTYSLLATLDNIDPELSPTSENPVQNKAIYGAYENLSSQLSQKPSIQAVQDMIAEAVLNALTDTY